MALSPSLRRLLATAALGLVLCTPVSAQDRATLVADSLQIAGDSQLVADGSVEVFFQGRRLTASRIVYDQKAGTLKIDGPIRLTDETGETVILASQADLSADMTEGLLTSARVVLNQQLQIAAAEARRIGGRYLQLDNAVASSCRVCAGSDIPLWEIRARRVTHDQTERQIYFDHAQLRFGGVPVLYIPRLRLPDPTLKRASGFLLPTFTSSTLLGTGISLPYFLTLGPSRDLTITPFASNAEVRNVTLRYRQAFATGEITVTGAAAQDDIDGKSKLRGYVFADGSFALPHDYRLTFRGEAVSDPSYLSDYDIREADRLTSSVAVSRVSQQELVYGTLRNIDTLRSADVGSSIPTLLADALWQHRFAAMGGNGNLRFASHGHLRSSTSQADANGDGIPDGRDVARASISADWRRDWVLPHGLLGAVMGEASLDFYDVAQDPVYAGSIPRVWGAVGAELRWPLVKTERGGGRQVLEPVLQIVAAPNSSKAVPNEDSTLVEFDEASLFSLNRFPGSDAVETGLHANIGVNWTRYDPDGWSMGATVGRVLRAEDGNGFSDASGLGGMASDWLAALHVQSAGGLYAAGRIIADDSLDVARGEMQLEYSNKGASFSSGYIWSIADVTEARTDDISELVMAAGYNLTDSWRAKVSGRYDFAAEEASRADLGLTFRNECVLLDLSLSRRFTTSTTVQPGTKFGLTLELIGFGGSDGAGPARMCRR
ncbi:LPS-assembly protein LptD [Paragemmobacter straminiformis]|uniref:LPS-assembly protein LptD n=1 Tax=Paragemmobacter straminiformis TaxID=2045119 RepID=A0A842I7M0_9RHOB|nr:LPS assembly protein LptD [Gemmobacter straminiformis]MBC2835393.1 LPS-assembly protein LptD [Gemmobacter straminiformis]